MFCIQNVHLFKDVWENGMYNEIHFTFNNTILSSEVITNNYSEEKIVLQHTTIFGIQNEPKNVQVNGNEHINYFFNTTEEVSNSVSLLLPLVKYNIVLLINVIT